MTAEDLLINTHGETFEYKNVIQINKDTREMTIPVGEELFGVEGDHDVTRKYFSVSKIVGDNIDLSGHNIYVNYVMADRLGNPLSETIGRYLCNDVIVSDEAIMFSWKLSELVLQDDGYVAFSISAKRSENGILKTVWYTAPGVGRIKKTIREGDDLTQVYPDVIDELINRVAALESGSSGPSVPGTGGAVSSVNGQTGEVKLDIPTIEFVVWEEND